MVQNTLPFGSAHSKGLSSENERAGKKKAADRLPLERKLTQEGLYLNR